MRTRQIIALVLAMSVGTAIAVAQLVKNEPNFGTADKVQEQSQVSAKDSEVGNRLRSLIGEEVEKLVVVLRPAGVVAERPDRAK